MAQMTNSELWTQVRVLRSEAAEKDEKNAALQAELDKLQAELDRVAAGTEALEYEVKRLQAELGKAVTEKRLAQEKKLSYNRGFQEGRSK